MQATPNPAFRPLTDIGRWERLRNAMRRFRTVSAMGTVALAAWILLFVIAIAAPVLAPYPPNEADYGAVRQGPSAAHLLGTDNLGRDILSRIIHGARITLMVSVTSVFLGDAIGFVWGVISGFLGRRFDLFSQRVIDILMSFPSLILAPHAACGAGGGHRNRDCGHRLDPNPGRHGALPGRWCSPVREAMYVEAARSIGVNNLRLMVRHVAPQVAAPILVVATLHLGGAIFAESALSFLGLGIPPPAPSWGNMLGGVTAAAFKPPWWLVVFPGLAITLTIMAANLFGDALRDFLDPKLRQRID